MHKSKKESRAVPFISGGSIAAMLKSVKPQMSAKEYRELCRVVNGTAGYADKKGLIYASIQAKMTQRETVERRQLE